MLALLWLVSDLDLLPASETLCILDGARATSLVLLNESSTRKKTACSTYTMHHLYLSFLCAAGGRSDAVLARRRQVSSLVKDLLDALLFLTGQLSTSTAGLRDEAPVMPADFIALV